MRKAIDRIKLDITFLDEWLQENKHYSQEERDLIVGAIEEYISVLQTNNTLWKA